MKKSISLLLALLLCLFSLSSCSVFSKVKVNGVKIDNEVYDYFKDMHDGNESQIEASILKYVTINTEFQNRSLSLSPARKAELSATVNDLWHLYGIHYSDLGISKQTIYKIETSKAYEDALLDYYYGENGVSPVSEASLKEYFEEHYIAIRFATGYLFNIDENGATVPLRDNERAAIINNFSHSADLINTGSLIETAVDEVHNALINSSHDGSFPSGFYKEVSTIKTGSAGAVVLDNYVFLVQRIDIFDETYNYYGTHRTQCLRDMKGSEFDNIIAEWSKSYKID